MLSEDYVGSVCEVKMLDNRLIATGRVRRVGLSEIEIHNPSEEMPILVLGTVVKLILHDSILGLEVLTGQVYVSNRLFMRVVDVINYADYERRRYFRLDVDHSAALLFPKAGTCEGSPEAGEAPGRERWKARFAMGAGAEPAGGRSPEEPEPEWEEIPVRVRNVSLCGLLFESDGIFIPGELLRVRMALYNNKTEILEVVVRRVIPRGGGKFEYGTELLELPSRTEQSLCAFLFREQQEQIRRTRKQ